MRVLHVIDSLPRENGGLAAVVVRLAIAQAAAGLRPTIACHDERALKEHVQWWSSQVLGFAAIEVVPCSLWPAAVAELVRPFDLVHVHGIWVPVPTLACWQAERLEVPTVITPHGMLSTWSLEQKRPRKALSLALGWRRLIRRATVLHALNAAEALELRTRFPGVSVSSIPNGIFPEEFADLPVEGESARVIPALAGGRRFVLFLARLHFVKAPDLLVDAFAKVASRVPDLDLVIAGPDHGVEHEVFAQVEQAGLNGRVHLPGAVYGQAKLALLRDALCLCQPSRHEGFSVSMLEALACALPVVTTRTANFPEIETEDAGIICAPDPDSLAQALAELAKNDMLRARQSRNARQLVERCYTWKAVAERTREVYIEALASAGKSKAIIKPSVLSGQIPIESFVERSNKLTLAKTAKIIHFIDSMNPAMGGPPASVGALATAQAALGYDVTVVWVRRGRSGGSPDRDYAHFPGIEKVNWMPCEPGLLAKLAADSPPDSKTIVHIHGIWRPGLLAAARSAERLRIPYLVAPRGMLAPWSLAQKRLKKALVWRTFWKNALQRAALIHALNEDEAEQVRAAGIRTPQTLIPNGVFLEEGPAPDGATYRTPAGRPYVLFLGRLHIVKGVDILSKAFVALAGQEPNVDLVVVGPDDGERANFERVISAHGLQDRVHILGPIYGAEKGRLMAGALCLCQPSRQEGFSMTLAEAMGHGVPVVITEACHFPEVAQVGAGRIVNFDARSVAEGMSIFVKDSSTRESASIAALAMIRDRYQWPAIAELTLERYQSLLEPDAR